MPKNQFKNEFAKDYILRYLQEADFNISNITSKEQETHKGSINYTMYQHKVSSDDGNNDYYEFPELFESDGTDPYVWTWLLKCKRFLKEMLFWQLMRLNPLFIRN